MIRALQIIAMAAILAASPAAAGTVTLEPSRDATMIEHPEGALANGSGPALFAGRTNQVANSRRRALLQFDVRGAIPEEAVVTSVTLTLHLTPSNHDGAELRLHRLHQDWGEGSSSDSGGHGEPAAPGDVTWIHTFFDTDLWRTEGGHRRGHPSARLEVSNEGAWTWEAPGLVQDVRLWLAKPALNFGWILIGDEWNPQSVKRFASREHPDPTLRPALTVTWRERRRP